VTQEQKKRESSAPIFKVGDLISEKGEEETGPYAIVVKVIHNPHYYYYELYCHVGIQEFTRHYVEDGCVLIGEVDYEKEV
jgi:hypothetical protein